MPTSPRRLFEPRGWIMLLLAAAILAPALIAFGGKLKEFFLLAAGDHDGAFAISPLANYILASLGFLSLFGWAALNGMFRNIEQPKHTLLETERRLDLASRQSSHPQ